MNSDFKTVGAAALNRIDDVLGHWLPGGKYQGREYEVLNPRKDDKSAGSFKINIDTGVWADFAITGASGSDLISLVAYIENVEQGKAKSLVSKFLGIIDTSIRPTQKGDWVSITPVPEEAIESCLSKHPKHGQPSAVYEYKDTNSKLLFKVLRFDTTTNGKPEKFVLPLSFCEFSTSKNRRAWRWKMPTGKRPIYRGEEIAVHKDKPILIVEGEKACDAAVALFPQFVAITWSGGFQSVDKTDWSPIAGRNVLLWPDNDRPGIECMTALCEPLKKMKCNTKFIDLNIFGEQWPQKADAADAEELGFDINFFKGKNLEQFSEEVAPDINNGLFVVDDSGVYMNKPVRGSDGEFFKVRLCDRIDVVAKTRDKSGFNWGTLVKFKDLDDTEKNWNIPVSLLSNEFGGGLIAELGYRGLQVEMSRDLKFGLARYLQGSKDIPRKTLVHKYGWHGDAYLLPNKTFGKPREDLYFYSDLSDPNNVSRKGSLKAWRNKISFYCRDNHLLAFAVSVAFAGPLLNLIDLESFGIHFFGDSSDGKSILGKISASVWGGNDYIHRWRATDNALEGIAAAHSDGLLVLDEIGQHDSKIIGDSVYLLGNGQGKARATDKGIFRGNTHKWRLVYLSSGEKTLSQYMAEARKKTMAGQEMRLLGIRSDGGIDGGVFTNLHDFQTGKDFAKHLERHSLENHGDAIYSFLESLCSENIYLISERVRDSLNAISSEFKGNESRQIYRASEKFSIIGFAGELAAEYGIVDWPAGWATEAAKKCFQNWVTQRGGTENLEEMQALEQLKLKFEKYSESKFTRWDNDGSTADDHGVRTLERWGWRRIDHGELVCYCLPTAFQEEICHGLDVTKTLRLLHRCGAVNWTKSNYYQTPLRTPGCGPNDRKKVYAIRPNLIELVPPSTTE